MEQVLSQFVGRAKRQTLQFSCITIGPLGVVQRFPLSTLDGEKLKNITFLYLPIPG